MWGIREEIITKPNSVCYIAKKLENEYDEFGNQIETFDEPKKFYFDIQPVTNTSENASFGELIPRMRVAVVSKIKYQGLFNEFDRAYIDTIPENETFNGDKADYRIYSIQPQNAQMKIYFLKIVKENNYEVM